MLSALFSAVALFCVLWLIFAAWGYFGPDGSRPDRS